MSTIKNNHQKYWNKEKEEFNFNKMCEDYGLDEDFIYTDRQLNNIIEADELFGKDVADMLCDVQIDDGTGENFLYALQNGKTLEDVQNWLEENEMDCLYEISETQELWDKFETWCYASEG